MGRVIVKILLIVSIIVITNSCKMQKVEIIGKYGTEIYDYKKNKIAEIPNNGRVTVEISKNYIDIPLFFSYEKDINEYVPFALNFEKKTTKQTVLICTSPTAPLLIYGPFLYFALGIGNNQYEYHYKYLQEQQTNQDIVFTPLKQTADYKTIKGKKYTKPIYEIQETEKEEHYYVREEKQDMNNNSSHNANPNKNTNNVTSYNRNNHNDSNQYSQNVVGTYYGSGRLMSDNQLIERYDNLKIVISKRNDNMVKVDVYVNSIPYFSSTNIYNISKRYNDYSLHHTTNDSYITIDEDGNLNYTYKNIRNRGYVLKVTAEKKIK